MADGYMSEFQAKLRSTSSSADLAALIPDGGSGPVTWGDVTEKPATFPPTIGTTGSTAAAGDHTHPGLLTGTASAVADATDEADAVTQLNALLAVLRSRGVLSA